MESSKWTTRWTLPVLSFLCGFLFIYLAVFQGIPAPDNGWSSPLRERWSPPLLIIGGVLVAVGIYLHLRFHQLGTVKRIRRDGPARTSERFEERRPDAAGKTDPAAHPMVLKYWRLSTTQRTLVVFLYEGFVHRDRLAFDDFVAALGAKHGQAFVPTTDECFYRMKDLAAAGFFKLDSVEQGQTGILKDRRVRDALGDAEIIKTMSR